MARLNPSLRALSRVRWRAPRRSLLQERAPPLHPGVAVWARRRKRRLRCFRISRSASRGGLNPRRARQPGGLLLCASRPLRSYALNRRFRQKLRPPPRRVRWPGRLLRASRSRAQPLLRSRCLPSAVPGRRCAVPFVRVPLRLRPWSTPISWVLRRFVSPRGDLCPCGLQFARRRSPRCRLGLAR